MTFCSHAGETILRSREGKREIEVSKMSANKEEDFACDKFVPQKWRKDTCRNCYQPARLHEKKLAKQPTTPTSPSMSTTLPTIPRSSTLPPGIKPPTPPKRVVSLKTAPGQKPPVAVKGGGGGGMASKKIPAKPTPPPAAKATTEAGVRPATQPKVFQRFLVKKEPLIDKNIPPKDRTKEKELEGIQPGIVKVVHDLAPSLKTTIPPEVQAVFDENAARAAASASMKNTDNSAAAVNVVKQRDTEAAVKDSSVSPPPPMVPPRPSGYELTEETTSPPTTAAADSSYSGADQKVSATAPPPPEEAVVAVPSSCKDQEPSPSLSLAPAANLLSTSGSQDQETNVEVEVNTAFFVDNQPQSQPETQTTAELQPTTEAPLAHKEEAIVSTVNKEEEGSGTAEKKKDVDVDQATPASEVKVELESVVEAPSPVTAEETIPVTEPQQEEKDTKDLEQEERGDAMGVQLPPPDAEIRVEPTRTGPTTKDEEDEEHREDLKAQAQPELDSEVKGEPQPKDETPLVCTEFLCPLPRSKDTLKEEEVEIGKKETGESQLTEPDSELSKTSQPTLEAQENVAPAKALEEASQDEGKEKDEEERREEGESRPSESVVEEKVTVDSERLTLTETESQAAAQSQSVDDALKKQEDAKTLPEAEQHQSKVEESEQANASESLGEIDRSMLTEPLEPAALPEQVLSVVPAQKQEEDNGEKETDITQIEVSVASETMATDQVATLESRSEGTDGGTDPSPPLHASSSEQLTDHLTGQQAQEATNEDISEPNQPIVYEQKQQLDEAPTLGGESGNGLSTERDNLDLTINQATSLQALEKSSSINAAAIEVVSREEFPEEEVKPKVPPPPPPAPWVKEQGEKEGGETEEGESASESPLIPPAHVDGSLLPPPPPPPPPPPIAPPPPPPLGAAIPKGPPKATEVMKAAQSVKPPKGAMAYEEAMAAIKGGVKLRSVPAPVQRPVGEEKVVDVASELRLKMLKQRRKEVSRSR